MIVGFPQKAAPARLLRPGLPPPQSKGVDKMLDLMAFKEEFVSMCRDTICAAGAADLEIEERMVNKAQRGELNGILFKREGLLCAPTFYVEDFYKAYKEGTPIAELSHEAIEAAARSMDLADLLAQSTCNMIGDPEKVNVRMLNKGRNKEYLKGIPCRELGCGFVYIAEITQGEYRAVITDEVLKEYGLDADELFDKAIRNSVNTRPAVLHDLGESVINGHMECLNLLDLPAGTTALEAGPGFVLSNAGLFWGAGSLFYPGVIDHLHELLDGNFYVLPSSVHELIIVRTGDQDPQQLADLVRSANRSVVEDNEILADDLFICEAGELHRVSYGGVIPSVREQVS